MNALSGSSVMPALTQENLQKVSDAVSRHHVRERALREKMRVTLGPGLCELLEDPGVTEIYCNPGDPTVWVKHLSRGKFKADIRMSDDHSLSLIGIVAGVYDFEASERSPRIQTNLPFYGARFSAMLPRVAIGPHWNIRKPPGRVIPLDDYLKKGMCTRAHVDAIRALVKKKKNIFVAGPQDTGKTTLTNAIIAEAVALADPGDRFAIIEDAREILCEHPDKYAWIAEADTKEDFPDLIRDSLRFGANRMVIGEIRRAASSVLEAWTTGVKGSAATIHGGSPESVMRRFEILLRRDNFPIERDAIVQAVHAIVLMGHYRNARLILGVYALAYDAETNDYTFRDDVEQALAEEDGRISALAAKLG